MYLVDVVQDRVQLRVFEHYNESLFSIKAGKFFDRLSDCRRLLNKNSVKWGWLVIHTVPYFVSQIYFLAKVCCAFVLMLMGILFGLLDTSLCSCHSTSTFSVNH